MRTIFISDKTYVQLEEILKREQQGQIERIGKAISETPEDMIPWLIGYYQYREMVARGPNHD